MLGGELIGVTLDRGRQLDRPSGAPQLLPALLGLLEAVSVEVVVPVGGSESCTDLRLRERARYGCVASVPQRHSDLRARLFDERPHERAGVKVDDRHLSGVLTDRSGDRAARTRSSSSRRRGSDAARSGLPLPRGTNPWPRARWLAVISYPISTLVAFMALLFMPILLNALMTGVVLAGTGLLGIVAMVDRRPDRRSDPHPHDPRTTGRKSL